MSETGRMRAPWTRRGLMVAASAAIGGLAAAAGPRESAKMAEAQSTGTEGLLTYLHQEIDLDASPARVDEALLDSRQFAAFSGAAAEIDRRAGGAFSLFGGRIVGRNIELVPGSRIVQAWRPADWEPGLYSLVRFQIGPREGGATVVLDHTGFP
ncbi:MAG TPA: SRPBCC domain-containing protein, partial [Usitatibacter sp.]|nr:SRPBCC domain-containing protein [Usitatibacter sp.]